MFGSWRHLWISSLAAALALLPGAALSLDAAELEEMETLLRDLGFDPGPVDGVVDADTLAAIRRYQEFAALPGEPEPSAILLNELRGVAAAFAALSAAKEETPPAEAAPEAGEVAPPESGGQEAVAEKVVVPPPPPPPKLKAPEEPAPEAETTQQADTAGQATADSPPEQVTELPPAEAPLQEAPAAPPAPPAAAPGAAPAAEASEPPPPDPAAEAQARIDAELAPFRRELESGSLSREALAKRFNEEGRQALQASRYDEAILKFSVAIHLNPRFAGAYSNRGTAYQHQEETDLAAEDFAKARQLGFGGMRIRDGSNPFN